MAVGSGTVDIAWWTFILTGALSGLCGLAFFFLPEIVSGMTVYVVGLFLLLVGALNVMKGASAPSGSVTSMLLLGAGILMALVGASIFVAPFFFADFLAFIIVVWALIFGIGELALAMGNPEYGWFRVFFFASALISILLGVALIAYPLFGGFSLIQVLGLFAIAAGGINIAEGLLMRGQKPGGTGRTVSPG